MPKFRYPKQNNKLVPPALSSIYNLQYKKTKPIFKKVLFLKKVKLLPVY